MISIVAGCLANHDRAHSLPWSSSYVHSMSHPQTTQINVFMFCIMSYIIEAVSVVVVSLMQLHTCAGSVCGGDTTLMRRGLDVHGWVRQLDVSPSTRPWSVEVYVSQVPHQGSTVVYGYIEGSFLVNKTGDTRELYDPKTGVNQWLRLQSTQHVRMLGYVSLT